MTTCAVRNDNLLTSGREQKQDRWHSLPDVISAKGVTLRTKRDEDPVVEKFGLDRWHNIFTDIDSDRQFSSFLSNDSERSRAYMLIDDLDHEPFGVIYLKRNDDIMCDSVEFHGGSWTTSPTKARLKFRASCLIIDHLLINGVRVRSKAFRHNESALRFLMAIGFKIVAGQSSRPTVNLTLSRKRFYQSRIYKYLCL